MKLPSINYLITNAKASFIRFPLAIISSLIAVIFGIYLIENGKNMPKMLPYINIMLCMSIGIPLYFCATIISNKKKFDKKKSLLIHLAATLILVAIYFTLPNSASTHNTSLPYIKYALYNITCHLLVSFIPFAFSKQLNGFWQYNKILFIRIWTSALYSGFIYVGLIIALTSLRLLFNIKIHEELYVEIWIVTIGLFNTWFFVGGIPLDFDKLDTVYEYPKGLKVFSQYVLLPLLSLYLIILYAYGTKILILWDWPKGIVSYLIIFVSVLGILAFLLLHPYGNQKQNEWLKKASKGYYFILFPLLIILFIALFMRVNEYGITINRYILLLLGIWLTVVCLYTASGKTNIKFIPTSLAVMLMLISFGPWGMFSISEKSQVNRLKTILQQSKILVGNKIQNEAKWVNDTIVGLHTTNELKNEGFLADSLHNEVRSILNYLDDHHGFLLIRDWYTQNIDSIVNSVYEKDAQGHYGYSEAEIYMKTLGLEYSLYPDSEVEKSRIKYYALHDLTLKKVTGYDYLIDFGKYSYDADENEDLCTFYLDSVKYELAYSNKPTVKLSLKSKTDTIHFELEDLINKLKKEYGNQQSELAISEMQLVSSNHKFEIKIEFYTINIELEKTGHTFYDYLSGEIFIKKKQ